MAMEHQTSSNTATDVGFLDADTLVQRAAELVPELRERANEVDSTRLVSKEIVGKFHNAGLYRTIQPKRFGGFEHDFSVLIRVVSELGRGCGSTAWTFGNTAIQQGLMGTFPLEAQNDFWEKDRRCLISGSYAPTGKAERVEGGYRVTGKWGFGSGLDHSSWHMVGALLPSGDDTPPKLGFLAIAKADYTVEDNWQTVGLRGTSSKNIVVDNAFVPDHRVQTAEAMMKGETAGGQAHSNPLFRLPILSLAAYVFVAPALGMVQDGIEELTDMARVRKTRGAIAGGGNRLGEFAAVQTKLAEASGLLHAARLLAFTDLEEMTATVRGGQTLSIDDRIRYRRNQSLAGRFCVQAINALFDCTGGGGLFLSSRIQRDWRDVNAVGKHIALNWDAVGSMYGQHAFGLEPKGQY